MWEVPDAFEHLEATALQRVMSSVAMGDGNDPVAISPNHHGGQAGRDMQLVERADGLTAVVHH